MLLGGAFSDGKGPQMKPPTMWGSRIRKSCWIKFCNPKLYFAFFSFWLDKMVMNKNRQMKPPTTIGSRIRNISVEF
eukprot:UN19027